MNETPQRAGSIETESPDATDVLSIGAAGPPGDSPGTRDLAAIHAALSATRRVVEDAAATEARLLTALRESLGADEAFLIFPRGADLSVLASGRRASRKIPRGLRATLERLDGFGEIDDATCHQLALVLGARSANLRAAFGGGPGRLEVLVLGWAADAAVSPGAARAIAAAASGARAVVGSRDEAVTERLARHRSRWAQEIHDGVTQAVTSAVLELEALTRHIESNPAEAARRVDRAKAEIRRALADLRKLLFELTDEGDEVVDSGPLVKYVEDVVGRWRLPARISVSGELRNAPKPVLGAAYVVAREALANAAKHSAAKSVTVSLSSSPEELRVEVADTGRGFAEVTEVTEMTKGRADGHFGMEMMRKRVAEVGGSLDVESSPGKGARVVARLPLRPE